MKTDPSELAASSSAHIPVLLKSPTGIKGFDEIAHGGLPKGRPSLIVGDIGCGKTFMAMEYVVNGITLFKENGVFMTFEEKREELLENVANLNYPIIDLIANKQLYLEHLEIHHHVIREAGAYKIDGLFHKLEEAIQMVNAKRVVLDSLDTLFADLDIQNLRSEFKRLFHWLKEKEVTAIVTAEAGNEFITRLGLEELVADCVIELNNRVTNQIATRRLRILKYRGSDHAHNEYPFVIDENRMTVFPIISQGLMQPSSKEWISSGIVSLDEMMAGKGFFKGSSILVSGTAGTGKTSIVASFVHEMCNKGAQCLFCAFEESPLQINRNMLSIGIDLEAHVSAALLQYYYARPTLQNLELHFMSIRDIIEKQPKEVIILDPITNLMTEGPNSDVRSMLTRFVDYLKFKNMTVMFSAAITIGSIERNPSDEGISSMVDTWINLDDHPLQKERVTDVFLMKSRGMAHSKVKKRLFISNQGIVLKDIADTNAVKNLMNSIDGDGVQLPDISH